MATILALLFFLVSFLLNLLQRLDHFIQSAEDLILDGLGVSRNIRRAESSDYHLRVADDLFQSLGEGLARAFVFEQEHRSLAFHRHLQLLGRELVGLDFQLPVLVLTR